MALSGAPKGVEFGQAVTSTGRGWGISLVGKAEAELLIKQCRELLNSEAVQDAILPAAQLMRDRAKQLVREGPGVRTGKGHRGEKRPHLRDLIFATKGRRYNKGMIAAVSTEVVNILDLDAGSDGPSVIMGVDLKKAPHAHLVEFGHRQVTGGIGTNGSKSKKRQGTVLGYVDARPFIRPAIASCRRMIVQIIESALVRLLAPYNSH